MLNHLLLETNMILESFSLGHGDRLHQQCVAGGGRQFSLAQDLSVFDDRHLKVAQYRQRLDLADGIRCMLRDLLAPGRNHL